MKLLPALTFLAAVALATEARAVPLDWPENKAAKRYEEKELSPETRAALDGVVVLHANGGLCAGALVAPRLVATAWHCVSHMRRVRLTWHKGGGTSDADVVAINKRMDLAVLRVESAPPDAKIIPLRPASPKEPALTTGNTLWVIGHPHGDEYVVTKGQVLRASDQVVLTDAEAQPGNSGGPMLDDKGQLVGIASYIASLRITQISAFAAAAELRKLLGKIVPQTPAKSWTNAEGSRAVSWSYLRDPFVDRAAGKRASAVNLSLGYAFFDRVLASYERTLFRHEVRSGYILGYRFRFGSLSATPYGGIAEYHGDRWSGDANGLGIRLELWDLFMLDAERLRVGKDHAVALTLGLF